MLSFLINRNNYCLLYLDLNKFSKMNNLLSVKIVLIFYIVIGSIFLFLPEIPHYNIIKKEKHTIIAFTREIGIFFIVIGLLIRRVYVISKSVYRLMNTTLINVAFAYIYIWERKQ